MDPVSHAVLGRVLTTAVTRDAATSRGAAAASILGALSPDVDFLLMPIGWDIYLRAHAIGTHSIVGALVTGLGSAALVRVCVRGSAFSRLTAAALLGAGSHIAGDIVSGARLRPGWPLADTTSAIPLVAMADPWMIGILAIGAVMVWRARERKRRVARRVLLILAVFLAVKTALFASAIATFTPERPRSHQRVAEARWASLDEWFIFDRTQDAVRQWIVNARRRPPTLLLSWPLVPESPLVTASRPLDTVRNFLQVHELVFAVERLEADRPAVLWSDIRYCWRGNDETDPIVCGLWFGGVFETDGRALRQQVRVGSWVQTRPPPE
jgi:membrane-bound metal-dependent hydrolase YbcI (DUF457 family)